MALRLSRLFGKGGGDPVVMKDGANNVTLENAVSTPGGDAGNPATFELTPAGSHAQALENTGGETQALAGDRFVAAREASTGTAAGVHDIHMNQGNTQSIQQGMQNENRQFRESARTQPPDAAETDGVMQHNQSDLEFVRVRRGATADSEYGDSGPLEIKFEDVANDSGTNASKWELSELDAAKNEVAIESLELAHEGILAGNENQNQQGVIENLNVKYTLLDGEEPQNIGVKYTTLLDGEGPGAPGVTEDATDAVLNIKSDSEVTDYSEGGTSLHDFNPKEAATGDGFVYDWIKSSALPEVEDEVLVQFQAREPGKIEFPNLARGSHSDTMPMEEVGFVRGTGGQGQLGDDGPSTLLGDFDGDGRVETTDAMSLNFEEIKLSALQDGVEVETESDVLASDFDGIEIPD